MQLPLLPAWGLLLALAGTGCSRDIPSPPARAPAPVAAPAALSTTAVDVDDATLVLADLMDLLADPAAGVVLAAADQPTSHGREIRSAEAWQAVADAAGQLVQTSSLLSNAALARGRSDWLQSTTALNAGATAAAAAARRHDQPGLLTAAAQVRASCQACHARYASQLGERLVPGAAR
jgi:hypothetical protein